MQNNDSSKMNTISIKTKPFLYFSVVLCGLVLLGVNIIYVTTDYYRLHQTVSTSHRLRKRFVLVDSDTPGLSGPLFNGQSLSYATATTANSLADRTEKPHEGHSSTVNETIDKQILQSASNTHFGDSNATKQATNPVTSTTAVTSEAKTTHTTYSSKPDDTEALADTARRIFEKKRVVLFTLINDAYLTFAASWLCNTASMADLHHHVLFLTTDAHTAATLHTLSPHIHALSLNASRFSGNQVYSHAGYVRLMVERTRQILRLLEMGMPLLLFEVDCVWMANPLPLLLPQAKEHDIVATKVENRTAGGFLFLNPTPSTLTLWRRLTTQMQDLLHELKSRPDSSLVFWELNDQEYLSGLIKQEYGGVRVSHLSEELFPDGTWYFKPEEEREVQSRPVIINNNFVSGNEAKRKRARLFGHWFLTEGSSQDAGFFCNSTAVDSVVHKGR